MSLPRLRRARARRSPRMRGARVAILSLAACLSLLGALAFAQITAPRAVAIPARPVTRTVPVEHSSAQSGQRYSAATERVAMHTTQRSTTPDGGCQVSVHVTQTNVNGHSQQTSSSSTSGSCSSCSVSVQTTQTSSNGSNINIDRTVQSCGTNSGQGVHIAQNGQSVSVSRDGSSVTVTQGGRSVSVSSGGTSVHIAQNGHDVSISIHP